MRQLKIKKISLSLFHPFLLGIYPLISLWAANLGQIPPFAIGRSLLFELGLIAITWITCRLIFRNTGKAALLNSLAFSIFYSFGHVYTLLGGPEVLQYRVLLGVWALLLVGGLILIARARSIPDRLHTILTTAALFLVLFPGLQILVHSIAHPEQSSPPRQSTPIVIASPLPDSPDVYFILIDNYSRSDVLKELGFDNSSFIQSLTELGFVVDPCAQTNYDYTHTSLASTLNMNYLEALEVPIYPELNTEKIDDFAGLIQHSQVRRQFASLGYQIITFRGAYPWLNIPDSNIYYDPEVSTGWINRQEAINFQYIFFRTTLLLPVMDWLDSAGTRLEKLPSPVLRILDYINPKSSLFLSRQYLDYRNNLFAFQQLVEIPLLPGKKFVYAHIFSTHVPFVFNADGSLRASGGEDAESYLQSVMYTNTRVLEIVKTILQESAAPPVIILQGDHGFVTTPERVRILNALYLPGAPGLHSNGVTPVNTFRLVFTHYFGLDYPTLPDHSYHTPPGQAYIFDPVPASCVAK